MQDINDLMDSILRDLKARPIEALATLPSVTESKRQVTDGEYSLAVWKDTLDDGSTRIVVQAYRYHVLGIGTMRAKGFVISKNSVVRDLSREDLWDFT